MGVLENHIKKSGVLAEPVANQSVEGSLHRKAGGETVGVTSVGACVSRVR